MPQLELFDARPGQPKIGVEGGVRDIVPDFTPDLAAHAELLDACGVSVDQQKRLSIVYRSFSDGVLEGVRQTGQLDTNGFKDLGVGGRFNHVKGRSPSIEVYVGHHFAYTEDNPDSRLARVEIGEVNTAALHELGHFVDGERRQSTKADMRINVAVKIGLVGTQVQYAARGLRSPEGLEWLLPVYTSNLPLAVAAIVGTTAVGRMLSRGGLAAAEGVCYRTSPQERYARQFAEEHEQRKLVSGTPIVTDIGEAILRSAEAA